MLANPGSNITISAFQWVPDFAQGMVRDIRIRWALEEIERPYDTSRFDATQPRDADYRQWQPFGQVPAFDDGNVRMFESGAILLFLGEQDDRLLPVKLQDRWESTAWLIAALNSVEPILSTIVSYDIFHADKDWAKAARPAAVELAEARLQSVSDALGDKNWLTGRFTIADIMMVTVLRNLRHTDIVAGFPKLAAYQLRGEQRPAFQRALKAQTEPFAEHQPQPA
ncbi:glutathione S-transferase family protein [Parasphingorhabdus flavimaris]|mgnify:FL=1|jgi:glutathione S-transferase|uniref:Glutathione S-transferase family protein n=1 Tax=Parasphingorhabdus flavimaris TaxID=266812 RepID=A0ABX2MZS8_9SPHN|nr:glutathione S-transferase family protein [Parasphingorhabdus flavimaris]NVD26955.1 glutathione S-transferase family protein [Parasphingorhabdus flavimaris]|tara:strand:- start:47432 stop:48106 length:675 start_codon:yes stop_codon:yes gene_type:complete